MRVGKRVTRGVVLLVINCVKYVIYNIITHVYTGIAHYIYMCLQVVTEQEKKGKQITP